MCIMGFYLPIWKLAFCLGQPCPERLAMLCVTWQPKWKRRKRLKVKSLACLLAKSKVLFPLHWGWFCLWKPISLIFNNSDSINNINRILSKCIELGSLQSACQTAVGITHWICPNWAVGFAVAFFWCSLTQGLPLPWVLMVSTALYIQTVSQWCQFFLWFFSTYPSYPHWQLQISVVAGQAQPSIMKVVECFHFLL